MTWLRFRREAVIRPLEGKMEPVVPFVLFGITMTARNDALLQM